MNYLPLILVAFLLMNKGESLSSILSNVNLESLAPLLSLTGLDEQVIESIKNLSASNGDIKSLLPILLKTFNQPRETSKPQTMESNYFNPIKDIASNEIISTLGNYFEN